MTARQTTRPQLIKAAERRQFVLELRKGGLSYRVVSDKVIDKFGASNLPKGYDARYAWMDVKAELDKLRIGIKEDAREIIDLEIERLDRLFLAMYNQAVKGDQGAVGSCLRIMERRSKMLGLDAPKDIDVTSAGKAIKGYAIVSPGDWDDKDE